MENQIQKRRGRKTLKENERTTVLIPVRFTTAEHKRLKRMAKLQGEAYMTRVVRRLVQEAIK